MKKHSHKIGDVTFVEMMRPREGKFPIAKTEQGVIAVINKSTKKTYYEYGSTWMVEIVDVRPNLVIINPLEETISAYENEKRAREMALAAFNKPKPAHRKKSKANYQYLASYQK